MITFKMIKEIDDEINKYLLDDRLSESVTLEEQEDGTVKRKYHDDSKSYSIEEMKMLCSMESTSWQIALENYSSGKISADEYITRSKVAFIEWVRKYKRKDALEKIRNLKLDQNELDIVPKEETNC